MKKLFLFAGFASLVLACRAQQRPHYSQYVLNNYILNPALTGIENYADVRLSARDQWVGFEGRPQTFYLTAHMPIGKKDYKTSATSFAIPGENPRGRAYWENYTASASHSGLGLSVVNDITGNFNVFTANLSYAYHLGLSPTHNLAAGFSGGISRINYNRAKSTRPDDPALAGSGNLVFRTRPDLNAGLWLYSASHFLGLAIRQVVPQTVTFANDSLGLRLQPHLFLTAGYRFLVNDDVNALPSLLVKRTAGAPMQADLNLKFQYRDLLWLGGGYRTGNGFVGMMGVNLANTFNLGYAYDFTTTAIGRASRGTHEILLGFLVNNRFGDTCPRNVW